MNSLPEVTLQLPLGCQTLHIGPIQDLDEINFEAVTKCMHCGIFYRCFAVARLQHLNYYSSILVVHQPLIQQVALMTPADGLLCQSGVVRLVRVVPVFMLEEFFKIIIFPDGIT